MIEEKASEISCGVAVSDAVRKEAPAGRVHRVGVTLRLLEKNFGKSESFGKEFPVEELVEKVEWVVAVAVVNRDVEAVPKENCDASRDAVERFFGTSWNGKQKFVVYVRL